MKNPRDIIKRPIITERTSDFMATTQYVFEVDYACQQNGNQTSYSSKFLKLKLPVSIRCVCLLSRNAMANIVDIHPNGKKRSFSFADSKNRFLNSLNPLV